MRLGQCLQPAEQIFGHAQSDGAILRFGRLQETINEVLKLGIAVGLGGPSGLLGHFANTAFPVGVGWPTSRGAAGEEQRAWAERPPR